MRHVVADRKLEVRGDDVTLPACTVDMGAGGEARPLDDGEISAAIGAQAAAVCAIEVVQAPRAPIYARRSAELVVDGTGRAA